jgi:hypothetical protein
MQMCFRWSIENSFDQALAETMLSISGGLDLNFLVIARMTFERADILVLI